MSGTLDRALEIDIPCLEKINETDYEISPRETQECRASARRSDSQRNHAGQRKIDDSLLATETKLISL